MKKKNHNAVRLLLVKVLILHRLLVTGDVIFKYLIYLGNNVL